MLSNKAVMFVSGGATFFLCYLLLLMPVTAVLSGDVTKAHMAFSSMTRDVTRVQPQMRAHLSSSRSGRAAVCAGRQPRTWVPNRSKSPSQLLRMADEDESKEEQLTDGNSQDWRAFRARLVQTGITSQQKDNRSGRPAKEPLAEHRTSALAQGGATSDKDAQAGTAWVHALVSVERGCLLLANPLFFKGTQSYFDKGVIAVIEHGKEGTIGFITNRITPYPLGHVLPSLTVFKDCPLFYGGPVGSGIQVLHRVPGLKDAREVMPGLFWGADLESASAAVAAGRANVDDFLFFYKYSSWAPSQLEIELSNQIWYVAAADSSTLFPKNGVGGAASSTAAHAATTVTHVESWHYFLKMIGGKYEAVSQKARLDDMLRRTGEQARKPWSGDASVQRQADAGAGLSLPASLANDQQRSLGQEDASMLNDLSQLNGLRFGWIRDLLASSDIEDGAVLVASLVDEFVSLEDVRSELDAVAEEVRQRLRTVAASGSQARRTVEAMNEVLFAWRGMRGDTSDYYNSHNSLIHKVLERRKGNPITISVIYMAVARRVGVAVNGINTPSHFLLRVEEPIENEFVDCFSGGKRRSREEAVDFLLGVTSETAGEEDRHKIRRILATTITPREVYARMMRNLAHALRSSKNTADKKNEAVVLLALRALSETEEAG